MDRLRLSDIRVQVTHVPGKTILARPIHSSGCLAKLCITFRQMVEQKHQIRGAQGCKLRYLGPPKQHLAATRLHNQGLAITTAAMKPPPCLPGTTQTSHATPRSLTPSIAICPSCFGGEVRRSERFEEASPTDSINANASVPKGELLLYDGLSAERCLGRSTRF